MMGFLALIALPWLDFGRRNCAVVAFAGILTGGCASAGERVQVRDFAIIPSGQILIADSAGNWTMTSDGASTSSGAIGHVVSQLAVDTGGAVWGICRSGGVHEPSRAYFVMSKDEGKSWKAMESESVGFKPHSFVANSNLKVLAEDGSIWKHVHDPRADGRLWESLGIGISEQPVRSAAETSDAHYIAAQDKVWMLPKKGADKNWSKIERAVLTADDNRCWAVDDQGTLSVSGKDRQWSRIGSFPGVAIPFMLAIDGPRVFLAGEGKGWKAYGAMMDSEGAVKVFEGAEGKQAYSVKVTQKEGVLLSAQGLFKENKSKAVWERIWPREGDK